MGLFSSIDCPFLVISVFGLGFKLIEFSISNLGRMLGRVDLFQLSNRYLCVNLRRRSN